MSSIAHALMLAPPVVGKIYNWSFTVASGYDVASGLGLGATVNGGYIDVVFMADAFVGFGSSASGTVNQTGATCGWPVFAGRQYTWEIPATGTGLTQYLLCSAVTGTVQAYAMKSSFATRQQFSDYIAGRHAANP